MQQPEISIHPLIGRLHIKVACMKRELKFWQIVSVGTVVMGMLLGWML